MVVRSSRQVRASATILVLMLSGLLLLPVAASAASPTLTLSLASGPPTTTTTVSGSGYPSKHVVTITFDGTTLASTSVGGNGKFSAQLAVPATALPGGHTVAGFDVTGLGATAVFTVQTNWADARFDAQGSGANPYENVLGPGNVAGLAQRAAPQWGSFLDSSPIYAGGLVYATSEDGTVRAFDPATGDQRWLFGLRNPGPQGSAAFVLKNPGPQGCALVAVASDGTVSAVDPAAGRLLWTYRNPGPAGFPLALPSVTSKKGGAKTLVSPLVVTSGDGTLTELNGCTGQLLWTFRNPGPPGVPSGAAVLPGVSLADGTTRTIIIVAIGGALTANDGATGRLLWTYKNPGPIGSPAAFGAGAAGRIVMGVASALVELDAASGTPLWSTDLGSNVLGSVAINPSATQLVAGNEAGDMVSLDPNSGAIVWAYKNPGPAGSPAVANGVVYVEKQPGPIGTVQDGMLEALDAASGNPLFSADLGATSPAPNQMPGAAVADGMVFSGDFTGGLRIFALP